MILFDLLVHPGQVQGRQEGVRQARREHRDHPGIRDPAEHRRLREGAEIGSNDPDLTKFPLYVHGKVYLARAHLPAAGLERPEPARPSTHTGQRRSGLPPRLFIPKDRPEDEDRQRRRRRPPSTIRGGLALCRLSSPRTCKRMKVAGCGTKALRSPSRPTCRLGRSARKWWSPLITPGSPILRLVVTVRMLGPGQPGVARQADDHHPARGTASSAVGGSLTSASPATARRSSRWSRPPRGSRPRCSRGGGPEAQGPLPTGGSACRPARPR